MRHSEAAADEVRAEAFTRYVLPETNLLFRVALTLTRQPADAEDLVQDTLVRAYRAVERFDGKHPRAWLLTILRNTHLNRNRRRRPALFNDPDHALAQLDVVDPGGSAEDVFLDGRFDAAVDAAFAELPQRYQQAVALVDIEGLTYQEAAHVLQVPKGTVLSRVHRARNKIRKRLKAAGFVRRGGGR